MPYCSGCGESLDDSAVFCPRCGRRVGSTTGPASGARSPSIPDHVAGALAYFVIPAIVFLLIDPFRNNRFVRFHCFQSLAFAVVSMIPRIAIYVPVAGILLWPALELALFVIWIILFIKAFQGHQFKLPVLGEWAEDQAIKTA